MTDPNDPISSGSDSAAHPSTDAVAAGAAALAYATPSSPASPSAPPVLIVARRGAYYRNMRVIMLVVCCAMGAWFGYDGLVNWPAQNARIEQIKIAQQEATAARDNDRLGKLDTELKTISPHSDLSLGLQKTLMVVLPLLGIGILGWALHKSRGEIRLTADDQLSAPGHPAFPLSSVEQLDQRLWDRKGIAVVTYTPAGTSAKRLLTLDDFVYERTPIDAIYDRIVAQLRTPVIAASESVEASIEDEPPAAG